MTSPFITLFELSWFIRLGIVSHNLNVLICRPISPYWLSSTSPACFTLSLLRYLLHVCCWIVITYYYSRRSFYEVQHNTTRTKQWQYLLLYPRTSPDFSSCHVCLPCRLSLDDSEWFNLNVLYLSLDIVEMTDRRDRYASRRAVQSHSARGVALPTPDLVTSMGKALSQSRSPVERQEGL